MPEIPWDGDMDELHRSFNHVALLSRNGLFAEAKLELNALSVQYKSNPEALLLTAIFRKQMWSQQFTVQGGGGQNFRGDLELARLNEDQSLEELDATAANLPPYLRDGQEQADGDVAGRLSGHLYACGMLRASLRVAQLQGWKTPPGIIMPTLQEALKMCDPVNVEGIERRLRSVDLELLRLTLFSQLEIAGRDVPAAKKSLEQKLALAKQAHRPLSAVLTLLRLGDLEICPIGDARTLGYDLASDEVLRTVLRYDVTGSHSVPVVTENEIKRAEAYFFEAERAAALTPQLKMDHEFALRKAYVAVLRNDSAAASLFRTSALAAAADGAERASSLYEIAYAILANSSTVFEAAIAKLLGHYDVGGVVSAAEMARGYAGRRAAVGDLAASVTVLKMAIAALHDAHVAHAEADLMHQLSGLYAAAFQSDLAIASALDSIAIREQFVAQAERSQHADNVLADAEKESESVTVSFIAGEFSLRSLAEDLGNERRKLPWRSLQDKFNYLLPQLGKTNNLPAFQEFIAKIYPEQQNKLKLLVEEQSWFSNAQDCQAFLRLYPRYESQAAQWNDPDFLLQIQLFAAFCDPAKMQDFKAAVARLSPIDHLQQLVVANSNGDSAEAGRKAMAADLSLNTSFYLAEATQQYDLIETWADGLSHLAQTNPAFANARSIAFGYKARALIHSGKAAEGKRMLDTFRATPDWHRVSASYRISVLRDLSDAEIISGALESAMADLETARLEQDRESAVRSGVRADLRESAREAMLRRKYILNSGQLSPEETMELKRLEAPQQDSSDSSSLIASSPAIIHAAIQALPNGTLLLMYSKAGDSLRIWFATKESGIHLMQSPCQLMDISRSVVDFQRHLKGHRRGWESDARYLYECFIPPQIQLASSSLLYVILPDSLFGFPFESLLQPDGSPIVSSRALAYGRYVGDYNTSGRKISKGNAKLVVGVNGTSLKAAEDEAKEVADLMNATLLLSTSATTKKITAQMGSARILHFAMHAHLDESNPYASYFSVATDQPMAVWLVFKYAPAADLIVLSACDTERQQSSEIFDFNASSGAVGIAAFFQQSSAKWTIASLWGADDGISKQIIVNFYKNLAAGETNPAVALSKAKSKVLNEQQLHPFYYSPLIISAKSSVILRDAFHLNTKNHIRYAH